MSFSACNDTLGRRIYFAVEQINQVFITYKDASGIWHEDRFRPLITALANLILSIILVQFWGIYGVLLGTVLSEMLISMPWILHNIFSTMFKRSTKEYVLKILYYVVVIAVVATITFLITDFIPGENIWYILLKGIVVTIVSNILFLLVFCRLKEFSQVKELVFRIIRKKS